jgi:hypothetical protein
MRLSLTNTAGTIDSLSVTFGAAKTQAARKAEASKTVANWSSTSEWAVVSAGFIKDQSDIEKVSAITGVSPRMIIAPVMVEQMRYFTSNRELFKKVFQPLGVLGNATRFSYGVAGIKVGTAKMVEENLKNPASPYYLGSQYEHVLDFTTANPDSERMERLTDPSSHYYSYLYTALLLKELMTQWQNAGYPISDRPEILATLFNIGFGHSVPNSNPQVGGSTIPINGQDYTFGGLAFDFYYSDQLVSVFSQ